MDITKLPSILFNLSGNLYGISCASVQTMVILSDITEVPKVPEYIRGVANLRGKIISLVDMRKLLGIKSTPEEVAEFEEMMNKREEEHIDWVSTLQKSVREHEEFKLTTDPHACAFGKWYDNYKTDDITLQFLLSKFDVPHKKIHSIAHEVKHLEENNDFEGAENLIESVKDTELKKMIELFDSLKKEYRESRREIVVVLEKEGTHMGLIVDQVVSVEHLIKANEDALEGMEIDAGYFTGVGKRKDETAVFLLDYEHIFELAHCVENMQPQ